MKRLLLCIACLFALTFVSSWTAITPASAWMGTLGISGGDFRTTYFVHPDGTTAKADAVSGCGSAMSEAVFAASSFTYPDQIYFCSATDYGIVVLNDPGDSAANRINIIVDPAGVEMDQLDVRRGYLEFTDSGTLTLTNSSGVGLYISPYTTHMDSVTFRNIIATGNSTTGMFLAQNNTVLRNITGIEFYDCQFTNNVQYGSSVKNNTLAEVSGLLFQNCTWSGNNSDKDGSENGAGSGAAKDQLNDTSWTCDGGNDCYRTMTRESPWRVFQMSGSEERELTEGTLPLSDGEWYATGTTLYVDTGVDMSSTQHNITVTFGRITGIIYDHCTFHTNYSDEAGNDKDGVGLYFDWGTEGGVVRYSTMYNNGGAGIAAGTAVDGVLIHDNKIYNNGLNAGSNGAGIFIRVHSTDVSIYNNSIVDNALSGVILRDANGGLVTLKNNIIAYNGEWGIDDEENSYTETEDYNLFYLNPSGERNNVATGGNSVTGDPDFDNLGTFDLHIGVDSVGIEEGDTLGSPYNLDFDGVTRPAGEYDIGAYQY